MPIASGPAADLAGRLAREAEAVCRTYLSNGRRMGDYWLVGDVANTPGRSLFVRLRGREAGPGAAGHWTDAATGEHGDLLDLIGLACELGSLRDTLAEARRFLREPAPPPEPRPALAPAPSGSPEAARRLFAAGRSIAGTLAETYLRTRGLTAPVSSGPLRYHPRCYHRDDAGIAAAQPALLAAVTDLSGRITGVQRTWLAADGSGKAPVATPRRAMGRLLGHGVRFGTPVEVLAVGEGIETMLAVRSALPGLPVVAALSATNLAALSLPPGLRHLYIALDADPAGRRATARLAERVTASGIDAWILTPLRSDFNDDLLADGVTSLRARLRDQLAVTDALRLTTCGAVVGAPQNCLPASRCLAATPQLKSTPLLLEGVFDERGRTMIIGNFRYEPEADTYTGELRTLTVQRQGVILRPVQKRSEREPDYRAVAVTDAGTVELGAAWRKRTDRGRDYLSVQLDDPALPQPLSAALFLGDDERHATLVWSRPVPRPQAEPALPPAIETRRPRTTRANGAARAEAGQRPR